MSQKVRIGLNFYGVFADISRAKSDAAKRDFGVDIPPARFKRELVVPDVLTSEAYTHFLHDFYRDPRTVNLLMPVPGMQSVLPRIYEAGHELLVITALGPEELEIAMTWWTTCRPVDIDLIVATGVGKNKGEAAHRNGCQIYLDDDLKPCVQALAAGVPRPMLLNWGYNAHEEVPNGIERVASWWDFEKIVNT